MTVEITSLTFECIIGILESERTILQRVIVDATMEYDFTPDDFLDYAAVAAQIKATMIAERFTLIEEALTSLSATLKSCFPQIKSIGLRIEKPDILPSCRVSVALTSEY